MKTCILLAMTCLFLLLMGCSNGFVGYPCQGQAWTVSDASVVTVYTCRMLPPDNSWNKDIPPSPYPDSTRYVAAVFNGQAGHPSPRIGRIWDYGLHFQSAGRCPDRSPIKLVMRDETNRAGS